MRTFEEDLKQELQDPESLAHFLNAQAESAKELLKSGVISSLDSTSLSNKTRHSRWEVLMKKLIITKRDEVLNMIRNDAVFIILLLIVFLGSIEGVLFALWLVGILLGVIPIPK